MQVNSLQGKALTMWDQIGYSVKCKLLTRGATSTMFAADAPHDCSLKFQYTPARDWWVWCKEQFIRPQCQAEILLQWNDTYTMREWLHDEVGQTDSLLQEIEGVYCDQLDDLLLEFAGYKANPVHAKIIADLEAQILADKLAQEHAAAPQIALFDDIETLPLFSGSAVIIAQADEETRRVSTSAKQQSMSKCATCHDTGKIGKRFCWCKAGEAGRILERELSDTRRKAKEAASEQRKIQLGGRVRGLEL